MSQNDKGSKIIDLRSRREARQAARRHLAPAPKRYVLWYPGVGFLSHDQALTGQVLAHHFGHRQPRV